MKRPAYDYQSDGEALMSPLMLAAKHGNTEAAKLLLEQKIDIRAKASESDRRNGHSALTFATRSGSADIVRLLLENKADIEEKVTCFDSIGPIGDSGSGNKEMR